MFIKLDNCEIYLNKSDLEQDTKGNNGTFQLPLEILFAPLFLCDFPDRTVVRRIMHPIFIIALFSIAKTWKQPKCPSAEGWIKKMWYAHTVKNYSAIKNGIMPFSATCMNLEIIILN